MHTANIFVLCDQEDTAPVWGYMLRQQGLNVMIERSYDPRRLKKYRFTIRRCGGVIKHTAALC
jgi:hypothetical protein